MSYNAVQMPSFKNFFPVVYQNFKLFTFGGYLNEQKKQTKKCEYYDMQKMRWF